jgi:hypothetical protein
MIGSLGLPELTVILTIALILSMFAVGFVAIVILLYRNPK